MKTKIFLGSTILCCALVFLGASQSNAENSGVTTVYAKDCNQTDPASCDFHGSAVYELKNNYVYDKGTDNKTDGVLVENFKVLTQNSKSAYNYSYQDGKEVDHLILQSKYASNSSIADCNNPSFCDNLEMDDAQKLNLQFNLDINGNYNDARIKVNYLSTNRIGRMEINVVDFDSLRFYIYDELGQEIGPIGVGDIKYLGYLERPSSTDDSVFGEDNYEIVSDNIFATNPQLKNSCQSGCNLRVKIVPFDTYHHLVAYFNLKGISVDAYTSAYEKQQVEKIAAPSDVRKNIVNHMFDNAFIEYKPSADFLLEGDDGVDPGGNKTYVAGNTYFGMPYGGPKLGSRDEFASKIENGVYRVVENEIYGLTCSTSVLDASAANLPFTSDLDWAGKYFYNSEVRVVDCQSNMTCNDIDRYAWTGRNAEANRAVVSEAEMYSRYANTHYGDVLVHKEVCPTGTDLCGPSGHARLVTDDPVVVYDGDRIDGSRSYITTTEISSFSIAQPIGETYIGNWLDLTRPNIANYLSSEGITASDYANIRSQWRASKKYTFEQLYLGEKKNYNSQVVRTQQTYVPFTYNVYNEIAAENQIEKPYATMIYDDINYTNYTGKEYNRKTEYDKIVEASAQAGKVVGTIRTNYKISEIEFRIKKANGATVIKKVYPTYFANSPETRYSFFYDGAMEEVESEITSDIEGLTIYATVGGKSIKVLEGGRTKSPVDPVDPVEPSENPDDGKDIIIPDTGTAENPDNPNTIDAVYIYVVIAVAASAALIYRRKNTR